VSQKVVGLQAAVNASVYQFLAWFNSYYTVIQAILIYYRNISWKPFLQLTSTDQWGNIGSLRLGFKLTPEMHPSFTSQIY